MNEQALKDRLRTIAQETGSTFNDVWRRLVLERFLVRLSGSGYKHNFIFKGGLLLSHYISLGRETKDVDFLVTGISAEIKKLHTALEEVCSQSIDDGFTFVCSSVDSLTQPHMEYPGFRCFIDVLFSSRMKDRIQLDIGIGDIVAPQDEELELFRYKGTPLYEDIISLSVYPVETIFAEKLETVISKGALNSRMKDYHDLLLLCRENHLLDKTKLSESIKKTFAHRQTELRIPIDFTEDDYTLLQKVWTGHRKTRTVDAENKQLPLQIKDVVGEINFWLKKNLY